MSEIYVGNSCLLAFEVQNGAEDSLPGRDETPTIDFGEATADEKINHALLC